MKTYLAVGIGDMMHLDSCLIQEERNNISEIFWGCRFGKHMAPLFDNNKFYPNLTKHHFISDEVGRREMSKFEGHAIDFWHFRPDYHANFETGLSLFSLNRNEVRAIDAANIFNDPNRKFTNSSFLDNERDKEKLYNDYILVHYPTSTRPRSDIASLNEDDWNFIKGFASKNGLKIIVVTDCEINTTHDKMIVLTNPDIRIVPNLCFNASFYMGCDSFVSILCSKILDSSKLSIKSHMGNISQHIFENNKLAKYFQPHSVEDISRFYKPYVGF